MKETFPSDWRDQPCFVVSIPRPLVPYLGGMCQLLEQRGFWETSADYERAYEATVELEACLMSTCLTVLIESNEALYRLINTGIYGQAYTLTSSDPLIIDPVISPFIDQAVFDQDSVMGRLDRLTQLVDNSVNGTTVPLYAYTPSVKDLIQGVIDALATEDTDLAGILSELQAIALLVA